MPVIVQHVYIAQCQWCDWESVGKLNESAARREERTHVAHNHAAMAAADRQEEPTERERRECKHGYEHYCLICAAEREPFPGTQPTGSEDDRG